MARGISDADVFEAADQLLARGERPTIERVRQELGRGSPNTVNRYLDLWWQSLAQRMNGKESGTLPAALLDLCQKLYEGLRREAQSQADARSLEREKVAERQQTALSAAQTAVEAERQAVASTVQTLRAELSQVLERQQQMARQVANLEAALAIEKSQAASALRDAEQSAKQLKSLQENSDREIARVRSQAEGNERRLLAEVDRARTDLKTAKATADKELKTLQSRLEKSERQLDSLINERKIVDKRARQLEMELRQEREARVSVASELTVLRAQHAKTSRKKPGSTKPSSITGK